MVIGLDKSCCYLQKRRRLLETTEFHWWKLQDTDSTCIAENQDYCYSACSWQKFNGFVFIKTLVDNLYACLK